MKFGCCCRLEDLSVLTDAGCDFFEASANAAMILRAAPAQFERISRLMTEMPVKPQAINSFLRMDQKLTGPDVHVAQLEEHTAISIKRAADLGAKILVFGAGRSRSFPEGYPREKALVQLQDFLRMAGEIAAPFGIKIVIQPLRQRQSNVINTLGQAYSLARMVQEPSVGVVGELFHMSQEREPVANLSYAGATLAYAHIAHPESRQCPSDKDGIDYRPYLEALDQAGYDDLLCIDCGWSDIGTELKPALSYLRALWDEVTGG